MKSSLAVDRRIGVETIDITSIVSEEEDVSHETSGEYGSSEGDKGSEGTKKRKSKHPISIEHQLFLENGFGPEDAEDMDDGEWEEYLDGLDDEKYCDMYLQLFPPEPEPAVDDDIVYDHAEEERLMKNYRNQIGGTEGFGVILDMPKDRTSVSFTPWCDISEADDPNDNQNLIQGSNEALKNYNETNGTDYKLRKVVYANQQVVAAGFMAYITFQAVDSKDHSQLFQARVLFRPGPSKDPVVTLVRPQP